MKYIKIKGSKYELCKCNSNDFEDILYNEVGCNFGKRYSIDSKYIIFEDNTLEGEESTLLKESFFNRSVFGTVIIIPRIGKLTKNVINIKEIINENS